MFAFHRLFATFEVKATGKAPLALLLPSMLYAPFGGTKSYSTMDIRIQAIHFDATEQLKEFIYKKLDKLTRFADDIQAAEVVLKVVKPEVANNKEASVKLMVHGADFFVDKTSNSFEESVDLCVDVLKRKLEKHKEA